MRSLTQQGDSTWTPVSTQNPVLSPPLTLQAPGVSAALLHQPLPSQVGRAARAPVKPQSGHLPRARWNKGHCPSLAVPLLGSPDQEPLCTGLALGTQYCCSQDGGLLPWGSEIFRNPTSARHPSLLFHSGRNKLLGQPTLHGPHRQGHKGGTLGQGRRGRPRGQLPKAPRGVMAVQRGRQVAAVSTGRAVQLRKAWFYSCLAHLGALRIPLAGAACMVRPAPPPSVPFNSDPALPPLPEAPSFLGKFSKGQDLTTQHRFISSSPSTVQLGLTKEGSPAEAPQLEGGDQGLTHTFPLPLRSSGSPDVTPEKALSRSQEGGPRDESGRPALSSWAAGLHQALDHGPPVEQSSPLPKVDTHPTRCSESQRSFRKKSPQR